jgi:hypothetical protein
MVWAVNLIDTIEGDRCPRDTPSGGHIAQKKISGAAHAASHHDT